eukprot:187522_1
MSGLRSPPCKRMLKSPQKSSFKSKVLNRPRPPTIETLLKSPQKSSFKAKVLNRPRAPTIETLLNPRTAFSGTKLDQDVMTTTTTKTTAINDSNDTEIQSTNDFVVSTFENIMQKSPNIEKQVSNKGIAR